MQTKSKPIPIRDESPKKDFRNIKEVRFTDKERKQKEAKHHTVGGV